MSSIVMRQDMTRTMMVRQDMMRTMIVRNSDVAPPTTGHTLPAGRVWPVVGGATSLFLTIIVLICDLFVSRDDPLMSKKTFTRTEQLYVLSHDRS